MNTHQPNVVEVKDVKNAVTRQQISESVVGRGHFIYQFANHDRLYIQEQNIQDDEGVVLDVYAVGYVQDDRVIVERYFRRNKLDEAIKGIKDRIGWRNPSSFESFGFTRNEIFSNDEINTTRPKYVAAVTQAFVKDALTRGLDLRFNNVTRLFVDHGVRSEFESFHRGWMSHPDSSRGVVSIIIEIKPNGISFAEPGVYHYNGHTLRESMARLKARGGLFAVMTHRLDSTSPFKNLLQ